MSEPGPAVIRVARLPEPALDAAAAFHREWIAKVRMAAGEGSECVVVVMDPAPFDHTDWRRAAAKDLARAHPDHCINIVAGSDGGAIARMTEFLDRSPAITGQYLPLAETGICDEGNVDDDTEG